MKLTIHAEVEGEESVQIYEGDSVEEAVAFIDELDDVKVLQCDLQTKTKSGEGRSLVRKEKGEDTGALLEDIKSWLTENV